MRNLAMQEKQLRALPQAEAQKAQMGMAQDAARNRSNIQSAEAAKFGRKPTSTQAEYESKIAALNSLLRALPKDEAQKAQMGFRKQAAAQKGATLGGSLKGIGPRPVTPSGARQMVDYESRTPPKPTSGRAILSKIADSASRTPPKPTSGKTISSKKGGLLAGHKSADGIAQRGKTKAAKPTMKKSGR